MKLIRTLGISMVLGAAAVASTSVASAQSLQDVLNSARAEREAVAQANAEREAAFLRERNTQRSKLATIKRNVATATAESDRLQAEFEANRETIQGLQDELRAAQGEFAELFGAARSAANELALSFDGSIISAQYKDRQTALRDTAQSETLPTIESLQGLYLGMIEEMVEQANVVSFNTVVKSANGEDVDANVTRVGPFAASSGGNFLTYNADVAKLEFLSKQPAGKDGRAVENYSGDGYVGAVIDPSLGQLFELSEKTVSLTNKLLNEGGPVGNVIIGLGLIGSAFGALRLFSIMGTSGAVRGQMRKKNAGKGNPLGRIMMAYQSNTSADVETLALKLDDAVLKEIPKLEGGLNLVKVAAAVAPLLGLLGTVIGMIQTFQAITLFGAGDPQIMADGISVALVTTVLGLMASIPLLLIHALASGSARSVAQILEEQAAGMIAEHAESKS